jgi:hypothetical protein
MRTLLEIIVAGLLIALAWDKPFKERLSDLGWLSDKAAPVSNHPRPSPSPSGAWMWDPNRKTVLDTPAPKASPLSSPSSILDPNHRSPLDPPRKQSSPHQE